MTRNEIVKAVNKREQLYNAWISALNKYTDRDNPEQQAAVIEAHKAYKQAQVNVKHLQDKYPSKFAAFASGQSLAALG